jgi:VanZ family protein
MKLSFHSLYAILTLLCMAIIFVLSSIPDYGSGGLINLVPGLLSKVLHVLIYAGLAWCLLKTFSGRTQVQEAFDRSGIRPFGGSSTQRTQQLNNSITALQSAAPCLLPAASCQMPPCSSECVVSSLPAASCLPVPCPARQTGLLPASSCTRLYALAGILGAAYAASDEWHQSFVAGRTASFGDVLLDCLGIAGLLLSHFALISAQPRPSLLAE